MLYLIGGVSRSGKTIVAKTLLKRHNIPYVSLDFIMMGFMHGVKEMEIHDKLWPQEIAQKMWRFLEPFLETIIFSKEDFTIEGEALLPSLLYPFISKYKDSVKVLFMGYTGTTLEKKTREIDLYSDKEDWLKKLGKEEIIKHISNMITYSKFIENEASKVNIDYVDTSYDFTQKINDCINILYKK